MSATEYSSKTLISIMKMGFNPPDKHLPSVIEKTEEKEVLKKINDTTVMLLKIKYLFLALSYSINLLYRGHRNLKLPTTLSGLNAMLSLYSRYFNDEIKISLRRVYEYAPYKNLKNLSSIAPEMYLTIIKNMDNEALKKDITNFEPLLKQYFEQVLKIN